MVKINLLGPQAEEEPGLAPEEEPEAGLEAEDSFTAGPPDEAARTFGGPRRQAWLPYAAVGLLVVLLVAVAWIIWPRGKGAAPEEGVTPPTEVRPEATQPPGEAETERPAPTLTEGAVAPSPSILSSVLAPTATSAAQVTRVLDTDIGQVSLGLLSQADGQMVIEILGKTDAELDAARDAYLAAFPGARVSSGTRDSREVDGQIYQRRIFTVELPEGGASPPTSVSYLEEPELKSALRSEAAQHGLAVRDIEVAGPVEEADFVKIPVRFKALGNRDSVAEFLRALASAGWNARVTKILLVPADWQKTVRDRLLTLVVEMDLCQPL